MLAVLGSAVSARADITFTFDSITYATGNQDTAIARYMDTLLGGTCATLFNCVTVTGLNSSGNPSGYVATDQTYNGDGHVVSNTSGKSLTLGDSNGATSNSSLAPGSTDTLPGEHGRQQAPTVSGIEITFNTPVTLLGFDYEIFPDGTCPDLHSNDCGSGQSELAGSLFKVNGVTNTTLPAMRLARRLAYARVRQTAARMATRSIRRIAVAVPNSPLNSLALGPVHLERYQARLPRLAGHIGVDNIACAPTPEPRGTAFLLIGGPGSRRLRRQQTSPGFRQGLKIAVRFLLLAPLPDSRKWPFFLVPSGYNGGRRAWPGTLVREQSGAGSKTRTNAPA